MTQCIQTPTPVFEMRNTQTSDPMGRACESISRLANFFDRGSSCTRYYQAPSCGSPKNISTCLQPLVACFESGPAQPVLLVTTTEGDPSFLVGSYFMLIGCFTLLILRFFRHTPFFQCQLTGIISQI